MKVAILLLLALLSISALARDAKAVREFRKGNPCPATNKITGSCPGWVVDHIFPLCAGGPDIPENMQWQEKEESYKKDAEEREICRKLESYKCKDCDE